jgi:hypothetical protein
MPDYENDIVFKPELTWKELCEWANSKGIKVYKSPYDDFKRIDYEGLSCFKDGSMTFDYETFAEHRTYEQMKTIIQALYEE